VDAEVERVDAATACVSIRADVKHGDRAVQLEDVLAGLIAEGVRRIVVDISAVTFLNSKLLDTLVRVSARIHPREGGVAVVAAQGYVRHMLEVTESGGVLLLEHDKDAALAALSPA
jgi:anti-anti-sigma factor